MATPNDYTRQAAGLSFQSRQITYAAFVCPPTIINDKNISMLCSSHDFQEDIYTAIVTHRQNMTGDVALRN